MRGILERLFTLGLVALSAVALGSQQPLTFRSAVDRIPVDVTVLDRDGRPVRDLTVADFSIEVDGRPRAVVSADYISTRRLDEADPDRATFSTNATQRPGRLIALVVDEAHIRRGSSRAAFEAAAGFVRALDRADRIALYLVPGAGPVAGFTSNHRLILRLLDAAAGQATEAETSARVGIAEAIDILDRPPNPDSPTGAPPGSLLEDVLSRECAGENDAGTLAACRRRVEAEARTVFNASRARTVRSLNALRGVFNQLASTPDAKTVVLLTEGLVLGRDMSDITWVGPLASQAQITLYGLRLDGELFDASTARLSPSRRADRDLIRDGLDQLVGHARGTVFPIAVNASAVFSRLEVELSGYYLLSFAPVPGDRDGQPHRITVRTTRPGTRLRARREFSLEAERPRTRQDYLVDALKSPLGLSDFTLSATTYHYPDAEVTSRRVTVLVAVALDRTFNRDGDFSLAWHVTDPAGRVIAIQDEVTVSLPSPAAAGLPQTFAGAVVVDPGVYSLTVAAVDNDGRRATVEHGFEARVTGVGQVRIGDVMLANAPAPGRAASPLVDDRIATDTLVGYVELASEVDAQLGMATATLELARDEAGPALESAAMRFVGDETAGRRRAEAGVPVALLPDGPYIARVVLFSNGRPVGRVIRPFTLARGAAAPRVVPAPAGFSVYVDPFDRREILSRQVVGFFLDYVPLTGRAPLPEILLPALGLSRAARFEEAHAIVERANVAHHAGPFFSGLAALARGDLNRAAEDFSASLAAAPDFHPAAFYLGACYAAAGRDREALLAWRTGVIIDTRAPWVYTMMVDALLRTRDVRLALEMLADATTRWPDSDPIRVRLATAQALAGQPADAVRTLGSFLDRHPGDAPRLLLGLRMLFEARSAKQTSESPDADRARFEQWAQWYERAGGEERELVATWRKIYRPGATSP